jgi:hypothetical protein
MATEGGKRANVSAIMLPPDLEHVLNDQIDPEWIVNWCTQLGNPELTDLLVAAIQHNNFYRQSRPPLSQNYSNWHQSSFSFDHHQRRWLYRNANSSPSACHSCISYRCLLRFGQKLQGGESLPSPPPEIWVSWDEADGNDPQRR